MNRSLSPNDPCHCGSGKKYKKCHMGADRDASAGVSARVADGSQPPTAGWTPNAAGLAVSRATAAAEGRKLVKQGIVSPRREVPAHITRPEYAVSGKPDERTRYGIIKSADQIARMRFACAAAREVLDEVLAAAKAGVATEQLDIICHEACIRLGGYPSPLNYRKFPKSLCTSVNEVVCHGIPDDRKLELGDVVNCDVTIYINGMHGDCSETVFIGAPDEASRKLVEDTYEAMLIGIDAVKPGRKVRDIGRAIQDFAHARNYGVVKAFCGHGIGELFREDGPSPRHDAHGRADDQRGYLAGRGLEGPVDSGHRRPEALRPVRAHGAGNADGRGDADAHARWPAVLPPPSDVAAAPFAVAPRARSTPIPKIL
jgi:methionyl aminopeptidase